MCFHCFFFSSRRRHTRYIGDWSSDVCSSDLELVGLGLPTNSSDLSYLRGCAKPKLLLQGDRDQYGSRENVEALIAGMPESERRQTTLVFIPEADHFFAGKLDQVHSALAAWLHDRHPKLTPSLDEIRN